MSQRPPDVMPEIVQRDLSEDQARAFLTSPDLAIDTETLGLQTLRDRLCLVQLCDRSGRASIVQATTCMSQACQKLQAAGKESQPQNIQLSAVIWFG